MDIRFCIGKKRRADGRYQAYVQMSGHPKKWLYDREKQALKRRVNEMVELFEMGIVDGKVTLNKVVESWFEIHCEGLAITTRNNYKSFVDNHLTNSRLGRMPILDIMPEDIQIFINELALKPVSEARTFSEKSLKNANGILSSIFTYAYKNRKVRFNPCIGINIKKSKKYEYNILSVEEFTKLLTHVGTSRKAVPIVLAGLCGLRKSEILALNWTDIDFKNKSITINKAAIYDRSKKTMVLKEIPKTKSSNRTIKMSEYVVVVLAANRGIGLVYPGINGGYVNDSGYTKTFKRILDAAGIPRTRFHDLRHFAATTLMDAGLPDKAISEYLGHEDENMTKKYQHILNKRKNAPADIMDNIFTKNSQINSQPTFEKAETQ